MIDELAARRAKKAATVTVQKALEGLIAKLDALDVSALAYQPPCAPNCRCVATFDFDETRTLGDGPITIEVHNLAPTRPRLELVP